MATLDHVRAIASKLPGSIESMERFAFSVLIKGKPKGFLWSWAERIEPKRPKVINDKVIAVLVPNPVVKEMLIATEPDVYFTEPHYDGFLAVLVRLESISLTELEHLIVEGWKCKAPTATICEYQA